jgi:hypothetical protein
MPAEEIPVAERGVRALPANATPAQRAHAEAVWAAVTADQPCPCSGRCRHGRYCDETEGCTGRLIHLDRQPGSLVDVTAWADEYACDACDATIGRTVTLPELPWGEQVKRIGGDPRDYDISPYEGTRHPSIAWTWPGAPGIRIGH